MGFRFHRHIRIFKGLYVNLGSKKGPSVSVGGRGITTNISGRGVHETFSLPGTGISYRTQNRAVKTKGAQGNGCGGCLSLIVIFLIIGSCSSLFAPKDTATNRSAAFATPSPLSATPAIAQETAALTNTHVNPIAPSSEAVPHAKRQKFPTSSSSSSVRVWVNTNTGVYHYPGTRWYGNTRQGRFESEQEAIGEGDRPARNGQ
jgi:Protein of unknown function (DUF4236)